MLKYSVGLDISSKTFHACISVIDNLQKVTVKSSSKFANHSKGFSKFTAWVEKHYKQREVPLVVTMEPTGAGLPTGDPTGADVPKGPSERQPERFILSGGGPAGRASVSDSSSGLMTGIHGNAVQVTYLRLIIILLIST